MNIDRAIQVLIDEGHGDSVKDCEDLRAITHTILRIIRDDLVIDEHDGKIHGVTGPIEQWLNRRIASLGEPSITGDTTTPNYAGYRPSEEQS